MDERTFGIILRTRPLTETSLIVHWLTPDLGRLATVAKGARRLKSPFGQARSLSRGGIQLPQIAGAAIAHSPRAEVREFNPALRRELGYLEQASYFTKLIEQTTEIETPIPGIHDLLVGVLKVLPERAPRCLTVFAFEMKLLHELGVQPDLASCPLRPAAKAVLGEIGSVDWLALSQVTAVPEAIAEIGRFLHRHMVYHLHKVPAGRPVAAVP